MKIRIINGPNLNLLGKREPELYGHEAWEDFFPSLQERFPQHEITFFQSDVEGILANAIQTAGRECEAVVLNAGAYTHTSIALADAVRSIDIPVIEVHLTNIYARESARRNSMLAAACRGIIAGFGLDGYRLAIENLTR